MSEQKQIEWSKLIDQALKVEGSIGNTYNRFYTYSYMNQLLLMLQGTCEPVATYKKWAELGRQVKKGSKAKEIIRPVFYKDKEAEKDDEYKLGGFRLQKSVFGLSDTDGDELAPVSLPTWNLDMALTKLDIELVKFEMTDGNVQGYATERKIALNPVAVRPLKTTVHELAHIILGHTTEKEPTSRGVKEFQAEATAYIVLNELESDQLNRSESRAYIQHWLDTQEPTDQQIKQVFTAVNKILVAGKPEVSYQAKEAVTA